MGDRYTITAKGEQLSDRFNKDISERYQPRYNAAPTQVMPLITQGSEGMSYFFWGQLPERSFNRPVGEKLLYAQVENIRSAAAGKNLLQTARCLIPSDGFYAWKQVAKKRRIPYRITRQDESLFGMAGIWEEFEDDNGELVHTFRILTRPADANLIDITRRIPFILDDEDEDAWLDNESTFEEILSILDRPSAKSLRHYTVSPRIENTELDMPSLIKPFSPADQFGNYSLFD